MSELIAVDIAQTLILLRPQEKGTEFLAPAYSLQPTAYSLSQ